MDSERGSRTFARTFTNLFRLIWRQCVTSISSRIFPVINIERCEYEERASPSVIDFPEFSEGGAWAYTQMAPLIHRVKVSVKRQTAYDPRIMGNLVRLWDGRYGFIESYEIKRELSEQYDSYGYRSMAATDGYILNRLILRILSNLEFRNMRVYDLSQVIVKMMSHRFVGFA